MKIAVEGCAHGELERIYDTLQLLEQKENVKVDLLLCCGDFQAVRNQEDLACLAVPQKYREMGTFYKYYSGEKVAPILTIFIGGNHEASNYLQELPYGGWVAPNIWYMGYAGVISIAGVRIAGLSGIYKGRDYMKGHYEKPPYSEDTKRSVYHIRNVDVFRLNQLKQHVDIFLSHDWPRGVYHFGDVNKLLRTKPFFKEEVQTNSLGSAPAQELLQTVRPTYWFAAHLHVKFPAIVPHPTPAPGDGTPVPDLQCTTKFLALDKCLPKRHFLQVVDVPHCAEQPLTLSYDAEWLAILSLSNHLLSVKAATQYMPGPGGTGRYIFTPTPEEVDAVKARFDDDFNIPLNFEQTVLPYDPHTSSVNRSNTPRGSWCGMPKINPQTTAFCEKLGIDDPIVLIGGVRGEGSPFLGVSALARARGDAEEETGEETDDGPSSLWSISTSGTPTRSSLVLPSPRLDTQDKEEEVEMKSTEPLGAESVEPPRLTESVDDEDSSAQNSSEPVPCVKRFKRRNYSLYCGSEDD